jgi:hypothetical protein
LIDWLHALIVETFTEGHVSGQGCCSNCCFWGNCWPQLLILALQFQITGICEQPQHPWLFTFVW